MKRVCLYMVSFLLLSSVAFAQPVMLTQPEARQSLFAAAPILYGKPSAQAAENPVLDQLVERLQQVVTTYGDRFGAGWSQETLPPDASKFDLATAKGVDAYQQERRTNPASKLWPAVRWVEAGYLWAQAVGARGIRDRNACDLRAATDWVEVLIPSGAAMSLSPFGYVEWRTALKTLQTDRRESLLQPLVFVSGGYWKPLIEGEEVYVPVRALVRDPRSLSWDATSRTATLDDKSGTVTLTVGKLTAKIADTSIQLSSAPKLADGRLMVAVRDVAPLFGLRYEWDSRLYAIHILPGNDG